MYSSISYRQAFCAYITLLLCMISIPSQSNTIRLGTLEAYRNYIESGSSASILLIRDAFSTLGIDIEMVYLPRLRSLDQANRGYIDGDLLRSEGIKEEARNLIRVPESICISHYYIYAPTQTTTSNYWSDFPDPQPIILTEMRGINFLWPESLMNTTPLTVPDTQQGLRAISNGRGNLLLLPEGLLELIINNQPDIEFLKLHPRTGSLPGYVWLHKRHKALVSKLAQALAKVKQGMVEQGVIDSVDFDCPRQLPTQIK